MKEYGLSDPVFQIHIQIFVGWEFDDNCIGHTESGHGYNHIKLSDKAGLGTLIHELYHAIHSSLRRKGIVTDPKMKNAAGEECHAYLLQYFIGQLVSRKFFIKHKRFSTNLCCHKS